MSKYFGDFTSDSEWEHEFNYRKKEARKRIKKVCKTLSWQDMEILAGLAENLETLKKNGAPGDIGIIDWNDNHPFMH